MKNYEINHTQSTITVSSGFLKKAGILGSTEYNAIIQLRHDWPGYAFVQREIKRKPGKQSYRNLTYENMREFIKAQEGEGSESLKELEQIMMLSRIQSGPYAYVKTWFLNKYKDQFRCEEETTQLRRVK